MTARAIARLVEQQHAFEADRVLRERAAERAEPDRDEQRAGLDRTPASRAARGRPGARARAEEPSLSLPLRRRHTTHASSPRVRGTHTPRSRNSTAVARETIREQFTKVKQTTGTDESDEEPGREE